MSARLELSDFTAQLGQGYVVDTDAGRLRLELTEATPMGPRSMGPEGRAGFSLIFLGPPAPVLPQRIYRLRYPTGEEIDVFLVPIGPNGVSMRYQAVFN